MQGLLDLGTSQAGADAIRGTGQRKGKYRRFGYVLLELDEIYFVERVRGRVIILQIICFFLVGNKAGDAFEHEVEMIRT